MIFFFFFFSSRRRHTRWPRDWIQTCALPIVWACGLVVGLTSSCLQPNTRPQENPTQWALRTTGRSLHLQISNYWTCSMRLVWKHPLSLPVHLQWLNHGCYVLLSPRWGLYLTIY